MISNQAGLEVSVYIPKAIQVVFREGNPNNGQEVVSHPYTYQWPLRNTEVAVGDWVVVEVGGRYKAVEVVKLLDEAPAIATKFPVCKINDQPYRNEIARREVLQELKHSIIREVENTRKQLVLKELAKKSKALKGLLAQAEQLGLDLGDL